MPQACGNKELILLFREIQTKTKQQLTIQGKKKHRTLDKILKNKQVLLIRKLSVFGDLSDFQFLLWSALQQYSGKLVNHINLQKSIQL